MLQLAAHLPDTGVGLAPVLQGLVHLLVQDQPDPVVQVVGRLEVEIDRVQQGAPDVVLLLGVRGVADPHRARVRIPGQIVQLELGELLLPADAVHDLDVVIPGDEVGDEGEEVDGFPVEAQRIETPEGEGGVPDPGVAVVVVPVAAGRLGQRGGAGRRHCAGRRIGQALQGECAALQVVAPRMIGEAAPGQPVLPVVGGPHLAPVRFREVHRRRRAAPGERHVADVTLFEQRSGTGLAALEAQLQIAGQGELEITALGRGDRLIVAVAGVVPADVLAAVVQHRLAVHDRLHLARGAADGAQQDVLGLVVVRRPAVRPRAVRVVVPGPDQQGIPDDDPAARRAPARLQDHGPRQIPHIGRHGDVDRCDFERTRVPAEQPGEHAGCVESWHAHPVDGPARGDECGDLTVAEEAVVADRHGPGVMGRCDVMVAGRVLGWTLVRGRGLRHARSISRRRAAGK